MTRSLLALMPILMLGCPSSENVDPDPQPNPDRVARVVINAQGDTGVVVDGHNAFTWDLYGALVTEAGDGNVFFSPFSVTSALSMTAAGAQGDTAAAMASTLHMGADPAAWHTALGALTRDLNGDLGRGYTLNIANKLFGQSGFAFEADFLATCADDYGAPLQEWDFMADPAGGRLEVNDWVAAQTNDRIKDLLPEGSVTVDTRLVLANAIYFLGDWATAFDPADTADGGFALLDGSSVTVPMMHMDLEALEEHGVEAGWSDGVTAVRMPYQDDEISMIALLPDEASDLAALEAGLDSARVDALVNSLYPAAAPLTFPRFELDYKADLVPALTGLGMGVAFSDSADFNGIAADQGLRITGVVHQAFVKVDEAGTEAAAATGVVVGIESAPMPLSFDRPFVFVLRDDLTGAILFVGRVTDPS